MKKVTITEKEYKRLKKIEDVNNELFGELKQAVNDVLNGRIRQAK